MTTRQLLDNYARGEPITIESFVIDTIPTELKVLDVFRRFFFVVYRTGSMQLLGLTFTSKMLKLSAGNKFQVKAFSSQGKVCFSFLNGLLYTRSPLLGACNYPIFLSRRFHRPIYF